MLVFSFFNLEQTLRITLPEIILEIISQIYLKLPETILFLVGLHQLLKLVDSFFFDQILEI